MRLFLALAATLALTLPTHAADRAALTAEIEKIAADYMASLVEKDHASGISISVSLPGDPQNINVVAGKVSREADAAEITPATLYQIGSITKSMTAAALLQLQAEGKLSLEDPLGKWLPQYPAWKDVTLRHLLNMTSGIPTYDDNDAITATLVKVGIGRHFSDAVLVGFADPTYPGALKPTKGYDYSNTNFILAGMVIQKVTGNSVGDEFRSRFLGDRYGLADTHYVEGVYPADITDRMASGYFWQSELPGLKPLMGTDMKVQDMSWAGAAGGLVSSPEQVTHWARALFQSDMLTEAARSELMTVVSMKTGDTIGSATKDDPRGFGLGVMGYDIDPLGQGWEYEGGTMGYRVVYNYIPKDDVVVSVAMNSAVNGADDQIGKVVAAISEAARK